MARRRKLDKLHTRLIEGIQYDKPGRSVSVRFDDGSIASVTLEALRVPSTEIENVAIDEFRRGIEFHFADGSMHDVSADYVTWLVTPDYATEYPSDKQLGSAVGANIRRLRKQHGISQAALAEKAGMKASNLSRLENGKHVPTLDVLLRIARGLGVPLTMLLEKEPQNERLRAR